MNKYSIFAAEESVEELLYSLQESMDRYTENNLDISTQLVHTEGTDEIVIKILKLNEHSN